MTEIEGRTEFLASLALGLSEGILLTDPDRTIRWASPSMEALLGYSPEELVGMTTVELQHPEDAAVSLAHARERELGVRSPRWHAVRRVRQKDGVYRMIDATTVDHTEHPVLGGFLVTLRDAAERHHTWESERRLRAMVENGDDAVVVYDRELRVSYASPSALQVFEDLSGTMRDQFVRLVSDADRERLQPMYVDLLAEPGHQVEVLVRFTRTDGAVDWVQIRATNLLEDPVVAGIVLNGRVVTPRVELEHQLRDAAVSDPLTGLPNRTLVLEVLAEHLRDADHPSEVAALFLDLDRFKVVNDSFGHATGDRVLVELGQRLCSSIGERGTVGRFGGDEYVVVASVTGPEDAVAIADLMAQSATSPFTVTGPDHEQAEVYLSGSVGIALGAPDVDGPTMLHHADAAMYRAKERGRGAWELYDEGMRRAALSRLTMEAELARALDERGFELWYQPIVDVNSGALRGFEALARWRHRNGGLVDPGQFIPIAEETGGIHRLGAWALATATAQLRAWQRAGIRPRVVSVNLSPRQLTRDGFVDSARELLEESQVDPSLICLEVTESLLIDDLDRGIKVLSELRDLGVQLALDDFGTGWSSLTYLRSVPVDVVKIDRSFIHGIGISADDRAIVGAVLTMCGVLGKRVVAEGVETEDQFRALRELGCTHAQGYLFAKPMPAPEVAAWLERYAQEGRWGPRPQG